MVTKEIVDFIYLAHSQTDEQSWFDWSENVLDYCDKFVEGVQLTQDEIDEIMLCHKVLLNDGWDYINRRYKPESQYSVG